VRASRDQKPAPPDSGAVVAPGVVAPGVVAPDGVVVAVGVLPGLLLEPHPAAVTPRIAVNAIGANRRTTRLADVVCVRLMVSSWFMFMADSCSSFWCGGVVRVGRRC